MSMLGVCRGLLRKTPLARRFLRGIYTPKAGNKSFYKGYGARSMGKFLKHGNYVLVENKIPEIVVPDLTNCELKPYVSYATPKIKKVPPPKVPEMDLSQAEVPIQRALNPRLWIRQQYRLQEKKEMEERKARRLIKRKLKFERFIRNYRARKAAQANAKAEGQMAAKASDEGAAASSGPTETPSVELPTDKH